MVPAYSESDQGCGAVKIRDSTVSVDRSGGKFGSDFRLTVVGSAGSHFVFLELSHLRWLEGVLMTAKGADWSFPRRCVLDSSRRRVVLARLRAKGDLFVRIISDRRSFADIVGRGGLSVRGRCDVKMIEGETQIVVSEVGLTERMSYLEKGVVFRLVGAGDVIWSEFRAWIQRMWGVSARSPILPIGDGLWFLECNSKTEDSEVTWVAVKGVPLHLRSQALARSLGEALGGFLEWNEEGDLSSLRIKIRRRIELPSTISISANEDVFLVAVVPEVSLPVVLAYCSDDDEGGIKRRAKGKGVMVEASPASALGVESEIFGRTARCVSGGESSGQGCSHTSDVLSSVFVSERIEDESFSNQLIETYDRIRRGCSGKSEGTEVSSFGNMAASVCVSAEKTFVGFKLTSMGLEIGNRAFSFCGASFFNFVKGKPYVWKEQIGVGLLSGAKAHAPILSGLMTNLDKEWAEDMECSSGPNFTSRPDFGASFNSLGLSNVGPDNKEAEGVVVDAGGQIHNKLDTEDFLEELQGLPDDEVLCGVVSKVATLVKLQVNGSVEEGTSEAISPCKEVIRRRTSSPLSWTERELKKLGATPEVPSSRLRSKRGERCALPCSVFNEF
ncbi:hypothetical protein LINPERPRIM_LOCUS27258 [Linum perenne]